MAYINKVINKFYLDKVHIINTLVKEIILLEQKTERNVFLFRKKHYQSITKLLMFLMMKTKPNGASAIFVASCFTKNLGLQYTKAVKTVMRYLQRLQD